MNRLSYILPFLLLLAMTCCSGETERTRMRSGLDSLNRLNRSGKPFTPAGVQPYVDFFDRHGTANDQLLAHYLMGRAYHEQGEAPMALQYYQQAAECADTTAADCDYAQLSRVYGQMGGIYFLQNLSRQQIDMVNKAVRYSLLAKDTLIAIMNFEQLCDVYETLQMYDSALSVIDSSANWYQHKGYPQDAAIARGRGAIVLVTLKMAEKAKQYTEVYERESGLFDSLGNIETGREVYYWTKGRLYLLLNEYDSAEYYFRKELRDGKDFNCQNSGALGLALLYKKRNIADSVAKYSLYAYEMNDSVYSQMATDEVEQMTSVYNYNRHREIAVRESEKSSRATRNFWIAMSCLLLVCIIALWLNNVRKSLLSKLEETAEELAGIRTEQQELLKDKSSNMKTIEANEHRIKQLEKRLGRYGKLVYFSSDNAETNLRKSPNYQTISDRIGKEPKLSEEEWVVIRNLMDEYFPGCHDFLIARLSEDSLKYRICLLLRLHFINKEIGPMIGYTTAYSSRLSKEIFKDLFGKEGGTKELSKELAKIF